MIITRICPTCGTIHQVKNVDSSFVCCRTIFFTEVILILAPIRTIEVNEIKIVRG